MRDLNVDVPGPMLTSLVSGTFNDFTLYNLMKRYVVETEIPTFFYTILNHANYRPTEDILSVILLVICNGHDDPLLIRALLEKAKHSGLFEKNPTLLNKHLEPPEILVESCYLPQAHQHPDFILNFAIHRDCIETTINLLISYGANPDQLDASNQTPLNRIVKRQTNEPKVIQEKYVQLFYAILKNPHYIPTPNVYYTIRALCGDAENIAMLKALLEKVKKYGLCERDDNNVLNKEPHPTDKSWYPLCEAVHSDSSALVDLLLTYNANPDDILLSADAITPLSLAIELTKRQPSKKTAITAMVNHPNYQPTAQIRWAIRAAAFCSDDAVRALVKPLLEKAKTAGLLEKENHLFNNEHASCYTHIFYSRMLRMLIEKQDVDMIRLLISYGADPDEIYAYADQGPVVTDLSVAIEKSRENSIDAILNHPEYQPTGNICIAIYTAVRCNKLEILKTLFEKAKDLLASKKPLLKNISSLLHEAVKQKNPKMVDLLVKQGLDPTYTMLRHDSNHMTVPTTPVQLALRKEIFDIHIVTHLVFATLLFHHKQKIENNNEPNDTPLTFTTIDLLNAVYALETTDVIKTEIFLSFFENNAQKICSYLNVKMLPPELLPERLLSLLAPLGTAVQKDKNIRFFVKEDNYKYGFVSHLVNALHLDRKPLPHDTGVTPPLNDHPCAKMGARLEITPLINPSTKSHRTKIEETIFTTYIPRK